MTRLSSFLPLEQLDLFASGAVRTVETLSPAAIKRGLRHQPHGAVYNLENFYEVIDKVVFKNALGPCVLRWSRNRWRLTLGLCDVKRRVVTVNRALDDARLPEVVVASVVHHEMLHLHFGISEGPNGTHRYHTPPFRLAEKLFPGYAESERWIRENWPLRGRPATRPRPSESSFLAYLALMYP